MKRNSKKQKGDGNEGLNISKENGIENDINNHDDDKEYISENDIIEMNHKNDNNTNKENTDNNDNNDVNTTSELTNVNKVSSTPQTVDSQGILNLFYLRCIILLNAYYNFVKCILLIGLLSPATSSSSSVVSQGILNLFYLLCSIFHIILLNQCYK